MILFILLWRLSAVVHSYVRTYMPSNLLLDRLRTRSGIKWALPVALVLVPTYCFAASIATTLLARGGPGWLNLVVMLFVWNAMKFAWLCVLAPLELVGLTARRRHQADESR